MGLGFEPLLGEAAQTDGTRWWLTNLFQLTGKEVSQLFHNPSKSILFYRNKSKLPLFNSNAFFS